MSVFSEGRYRKPATLLGGLILAALVARSGLALGLSGRDPLMAVRINSGNGIAAGAASDRRMKTAQTDSDVTVVRDLSRRAVLASPVEAAALRNLGFLETIATGEDAGDKVLTLAGRLSKRDYFTHAWLLDKRFRQGDVVAAVKEADIVLRQRDTAWPVIIPELVKISGDSRILKPMTAALARKPVWRSTYLVTLGQKAPDLAAAYAQLRLLRATDAPPNADELRTYFGRFDGKSDPERLWSEWLALTPGADAKALLRDGEFDGLKAPPPFNWALYPQDGVYAELSPNPDGPGKSLYVSYEGDREVGFAQQALRLAPGRYRLNGRAFADEPVKPDQLRLSIGCGAISNAETVKSIFLSPEAGQWTRFGLQFDVPVTCRLQTIQINGMVGDFRTRAALWIDSLSITRLKGQAAASSVPEEKRRNKASDAK